MGDHLISFSRYRGLVSIRVAGPDAPRVEVTLPLRGLPVGLFLSEGVATVLVVDPVRHEQTSRVVLVDVRDPARPSTLGEQRFAGTLSSARQVGGALHVLTREIVDCINCVQLPDTDFTWFEFDRSRSLELPAPRVTRVQGAASFDEDVLIVLSAGAYMAGTPAELRLARLSDPEPALSAPMVLNGAGGVSVSGDRLRVHSGAEIETYALDTGTPVLLGRGALPQAEGGSLGGLLIEGDRAVSMLPPSGRLVVLDLSDPNAPRITAELTLDISESQVTLAGDRVLAAGGSTLAADAPGDADVIARGPQALVLVDIADPAQPRILDRATLGGFDSVHTGPAKITSAPSKRSGRCSLRMAGATLNRSMPATTLVPCSSSAPPIRPSPSKCRAMSPTGATGRARGCTPTRSSATTSSTSPTPRRPCSPRASTSIPSSRQAGSFDRCAGSRATRRGVSTPKRPSLAQPSSRGPPSLDSTPSRQRAACSVIISIASTSLLHHGLGRGRERPGRAAGSARAHDRARRPARRALRTSALFRCRQRVRRRADGVGTFRGERRARALGQRGLALRRGFLGLRAAGRAARSRAPGLHRARSPR